MPHDRGELVDHRVITALFADFDAATAKLLLAAAESDLTEWSERLIDGWAQDDADARQRARHSLKGVCANFGATALLALSASDLADAAQREKLRACRKATITALREAVRADR